MATASKPRLKNLDDLFKMDGAEEILEEMKAELTYAKPARAEYATIQFSLMDDFPGHPFRLYEGERESDMIDSIKTHGILQSLIIRAIENGRYQILSGHNRKYCGLKAGLKEGPSVIKRGLTDEEAWVYVIETNLMQRSFADMSHSEKAAVIALQHSKLFSQGKRNDIIKELQVLENPHDYKKDGTYAQVAHKSREIVAKEYSLSKDTVARYLRIDQLIPTLKARLDSGEFAFIPAVTLSFLKEPEQQLLDNCIGLNSFAVDMKKADILRQHSEKGKLNEENIFLILSGEIGQKPKPNRTPTVKVSKDIYAKYFKSGQSAKEIQDIVEKAIERYFSKI